MTQYDADRTASTTTDAADPLASRASDEHTVVRHEERLDVSTSRRASGKVRIGKKVVVETVQVPVQVRREVLVYEELPADETPAESAETSPAVGARPMGSRRERFGHADGDALPEGPTEVVLHEERPVVSLQTVQVERVRMVPSTKDAEHSVTEPVRREQVELVRAEPAAS
ncbi:YsnF/AvaK domain-containing protein [Luteipulveratus halotolerans]|uniref:YsnF/AvaK domain-containing protein n=1 Tax=Luteipulveratus halotolerans TaxID=1631356 RepID=UPI00068379F5|nr:DUF2382 domain-containing protein [Luteipulveratus halotolerans]